MPGPVPMVLAVPSCEEGGLDAGRSDHFGRCDCFTIVEIAEGRVGEARVVANVDHAAAGCGGSVDLLVDEGVNAVIVRGVGDGAKARLAAAGITIFYDESVPLVYQAVGAVRSGNAPLMPGQGTYDC